MPRKTKKYVAAVSTAKANSIPISSDRERLYTTLEARGFNWSARAGNWSQSNPYTKSPYTTPTGEPTRFCRIRIEFHRDYIGEETSRICQILGSNGYRITQVSEPYENTRKDRDAERVYITGEKKL